MEQENVEQQKGNRVPEEDSCAGNGRPRRSTANYNRTYFISSMPLDIVYLPLHNIPLYPCLTDDLLPAQLPFAVLANEQLDTNAPIVRAYLNHQVADCLSVRQYGAEFGIDEWKEPQWWSVPYSCDAASVSDIKVVLNVSPACLAYYIHSGSKEEDANAVVDCSTQVSDRRRRYGQSIIHNTHERGTFDVPNWVPGALMVLTTTKVANAGDELCVADKKMTL